jgi:hypothetical protein
MDAKEFFKQVGMVLDFLHNPVPVCVPLPVPKLRWFRKSINRARGYAK